MRAYDVLSQLPYNYPNIGDTWNVNASAAAKSLKDEGFKLPEQSNGRIKEEFIEMEVIFLAKGQPQPDAAETIIEATMKRSAATNYAHTD